MLIQVLPRTRKPTFGSVEIDRSHPLARGLVSAWLLNESGTIAYDLCGKNHGPFGGTAGNPSWAKTAKGNAVRFSGDDRAIAIADSPSLALTQVSVFALARRAATGARHVVAGKGDALGPTTSSWALEVNAADTVGMYVSNGTDHYGDSLLSVSDAKFHSWGGSYDGTTLRTFLDGVAGATAAFSGAMQTTSVPMAIGRFGNYIYGIQMNGDVSVVYLYGVGHTATLFASLHAEPYAFVKDKLATFFSFPLGMSETTPALLGDSRSPKLPYDQLRRTGGLAVL